MSSVLLVGALAGQPGYGCVLPPDLSPEGADAGPSSTPVILSAAPADSFALPGPIVVNREDSPEMGLTAHDNDVAQTLYVRLYVDYLRPPRRQATPPVVDCQQGPNMTQDRVVSCATNALCTPVPDEDEGAHILEAMIADHEFILDSDPEAIEFHQPVYRALRDPTRAAYSFSSWVMRCQPPQ